MGAFAQDQAEGLRRLLTPEFVRVIAVASGRAKVGKTTTVMNLASALANRGKSVLILDEQPRRAQIERMLQHSPRHDLAAVIRGKTSLEEIIVDGPPGVRLVPAHEGMRRLTELNPDEQEALSAAFGRLASTVDVLLIDPAPGTTATTVSLSLAAQELLLLVSNDPQSITDTYALIKLLARDFAHHRFHVIVTKARGGADAEAIYNNMAQAARRYLEVGLEYLGYVPFDDQAKQAAKIGRPAVEAFPSSPSSMAFRALAERIDQWPYPRDNTGRLETFINKLVITSRLTAEGMRL